MRAILSFFVLLLILSGCRQELPEPEVMSAKASEQTQEEMADMKVHHTVQGKSLLIECFIPNISFSRDRQSNELGKVILSINGKFHAEYETAAFIVKNLPKGNHEIQLDVVNLKNEPLGMSEQFQITIQ